MATKNIEILETEGTVNVKYVTDKSGNGWYCDGDESGREPSRQYCVEADSFLYDRGFGG